MRNDFLALVVSIAKLSTDLAKECDDLAHRIEMEESAERLADRLFMRRQNLGVNQTNGHSNRQPVSATRGGHGLRIGSLDYWEAVSREPGGWRGGGWGGERHAGARGAKRAFLNFLRFRPTDLLGRVSPPLGERCSEAGMGDHYPSWREACAELNELALAAEVWSE